MRRRVWLGALALAGAVHTNLPAQSVVWKGAERPVARAATVRASSFAPSGVALDRPVARTAAAVAEGSPGPLPAEYRQAGPALLPTARQVDPIGVLALPGTIIASSTPATVAAPAGPPAGALFEVEDGDRLGEQFASERRPTPARSFFRRTSGQMTLPPPAFVGADGASNWTQKYPAGLPEGAILQSDPAITEAAAPTPRFYARTEYLLWSIKNDHTPPLVTTGSLTSQPGNRFDAALGNPDTVVLFGGTLQRNPFSGGLFTVGYALDDCGDKFVEMNGFFLGPRSANFAATSAQYPLLARPFFAVNPNINQEIVEIVTRSPSVVGGIAVHAPSQLWGLEPNLICKACESCNYRIDYLAGFRYLNLRESVTVTENLQGLPPDPVFGGVPVLITDRFATTNQFYGPQVGLQGTYRIDRFTISGLAKIAAGVTHEKLDVSGSFMFPGNVDPRAGGLLALGSNIGQTNRDRFAFVPEVGARLGYDLTDSLRLTVGYRFLYWSNVIRPGDQIDRNIDVTQIPNFNPLPPGTAPVSPARPQPLFRETDFWAQGLTVGMEFRY